MTAVKGAETADPIIHVRRKEIRITFEGSCKMNARPADMPSMPMKSAPKDSTGQCHQERIGSCHTSAAAATDCIISVQMKAGDIGDAAVAVEMAAWTKPVMSTPGKRKNIAEINNSVLKEIEPRITKDPPVRAASPLSVTCWTNAMTIPSNTPPTMSRKVKLKNLP